MKHYVYDKTTGLLNGGGGSISLDTANIIVAKDPVNRKVIATSGLVDFTKQRVDVLTGLIRDWTQAEIDAETMKDNDAKTTRNAARANIRGSQNPEIIAIKELLMHLGVMENE